MLADAVVYGIGIMLVGKSLILHQKANAAGKSWLLSASAAARSFSLILPRLFLAVSRISSINDRNEVSLPLMPKRRLLDNYS